MNIYKYLWFFGTKPTDSSARLLPSGKHLEVSRDKTLLSAALDEGLDWPHNCKFGSCGECKCRLVKGKIKPMVDFSEALTKEELADDYILACQSRLTMDCDIEVELGDLIRVPARTCNAKVKSTQMLTSDIMAVTIGTDSDIPEGKDRPGLAGMWAELSIPGIDRPRSYSFASAPQNENKNEFTFFIRKVPGGKFTEWLFSEDRDPNECVTINGPFGSFYLREKETPIVCIAGGSGLAPIKAILEGGVNDQIKRDVIFLFGARTQADLYCLKEIEEIKNNWNKDSSFQFIPVLNMEPEDSDWDGARGMVTDYFEQEVIPNQSLNIKGWQAYLCGPPPMVDAASVCLTKNGILEDEIFYDKFTDSSNL
jgi:xylene monooxygenase electron transfer component